MTIPASDTSPEAAAVYEQALMSRPAEERLRLATGMWATGRRLVESSLRAQGVTHPAALKVHTFLRFYARDLDEATLARVVAWLRTTG
jgi:hypothetical protein